MPEAEALLAEPPDDPECWALPAGARERVFGTVAKRRRGAAASWGLVLASVVPPVVMLALLRWTGTQLARPLALGLAAVVSFATALLAIDALAASAYAAWERALAARRVRGAGGGAFVGLAPGAGGMTYEGYADWDLGTLDLDPVALRYEGEQARFALERERIVSIQLVQGLPGWFPAPRVAVRWREASGAEHTFTVRDARARRLHQIAGLSRRLLDDLRRWHAQPAPAGVRPIDGGEPPREDSVTGTPHAELASPRTLIPALPLVLAMALLASLASGLSLASGAEPGALDVFGAALLTLAALRLPLWRAGRAMARQARRDASRAA